MVDFSTEPLANQLQVIVPLKDRSQISTCVTSIQQAMGTAVQILICDGGSVSAACRQQLAQLANWDQVKILTQPQTRFNKAELLNLGIAAATRPLVLISDADIVWNRSALIALAQLANRPEPTIAPVQAVTETDPSAQAHRRSRYTYRVSLSPTTITAEILPILPGVAPDRPGCGLICARRETLLALGGYKVCFQGWGWEDQDLLIRAQVLGVEIAATGQVQHLSHPDRVRNQYWDTVSPEQSRNANICRAMLSLAKRQFRGDLPQTAQGFQRAAQPGSEILLLPDPPQSIQISLPEVLSCPPPARSR